MIDWMLHEQPRKALMESKTEPKVEEEVSEQETVEECVNIDLTTLFKLLEYASNNVSSKVQLLRLVSNIAEQSRTGGNIILEDFDQITFDIKESEEEFLKKLSKLDI